MAPYGEASYAEPGKVSPKGKGNFVQPTYENTVLNGGVDGGEGAECDQDYMNQDPEGLFHTYTNQDDLMQQVRTVDLIPRCECSVKKFCYSASSTSISSHTLRIGS